MIFSKKAEIDEIYLWVTVFLCVFLIAGWFLFYISSTSIQKQNHQFEILNVFSHQYHRACFSQVLAVNSFVLQNSLDENILTHENNQLCVESEEVVRICTPTYCGDISFSFSLENVNFFTISKTGGVLNVEK